MKNIISGILLCFCNVFCTYSQTITTGEYGVGLRLAYDNNSHKLTGYFEDYSGIDYETGNPKFSCIFYIEGTVANNSINIDTYYPEDKSNDQIHGNLKIISPTQISIKLPEEHGGCWNVEHFADKPDTFGIEKKIRWKQIRYVISSKAYFYSDKSDNKKLKAYIVKSDFVCISVIDGDWAKCTYYGKKETTGWMKVADLNKI